MKTLLSIFFCALNDDLYYSVVDNIFELSYSEILKIARDKNIYNETMKKLEILIKAEKIDEKFYKRLI